MACGASFTPLQHVAEPAVELRDRIDGVGFRQLAQPGEILDIATGAEVSAVAAQDHRADVLARGEHVEHRDQFGQHLAIHGVARVGAIEVQMQHVAVAAQLQGLGVGKGHDHAQKRATPNVFVLTTRARASRQIDSV